ncbi:glycosyltransferase family 2 protein [Komagataeibacter sp. AV436]|uniref:Glycosyltransferase family 2 protein n=1 Tax=Komagataeibacter melomenusus TaxID=2766578 RepID=A0ABX2AF99_9PROT|nr:glycosyltransferase family 2 protein [Komagataeibacter melomenusus]MBV1831302.1 glycosyltransferase family 2 protein [Komagataeibacter melomenusus]NPC67043.1 glycosyltransferase family 2 protein [Komagataeibacter melomenusus]
MKSIVNQPKAIDVSIVMPCLNEIKSLEHCIRNAHAALDLIHAAYNLNGEIVIADNGSTDGSQALASSLGARVVHIKRKGYGAALIGGFDQAYGRYLIMGDCDGSYNFIDSKEMIGKLIAGADLCMGSRFQGGIAPGAMPWKNRYIGNPILTGILNLFFRSGIDDAHCGLRALTRAAYQRLGLQSTGMEFASEMVVKASLLKLKIAEVPVTLSPDLRDRPPHLLPWRDGWRHLRYLFMLSPTWVFGVPALCALVVGAVILGIAGLHDVCLLSGKGMFGDSWVIVGGFLTTIGHLSLIMMLVTHLHGVNQRYRNLHPGINRFREILTLETTLIGGACLVLLAIIGMVGIGWNWTHIGFVALPSVFPIVLCAVIGTIGIQSILGGFLLAIIAGHSARLVITSPEAPNPEARLDETGNTI